MGWRSWRSQTWEVQLEKKPLAIDIFPTEFNKTRCYTPILISFFVFGTFKKKFPTFLSVKCKTLHAYHCITCLVKLCSTSIVIEPENPILLMRKKNCKMDLQGL